MIQLLEKERTAQGFPRVRWEQDVPTGQSLHSLEQSAALKVTAVIMVFVFVAVYASTGQFWWGVFSAFAVAGMGLAGDRVFKDGITVWDTHIKGPTPDPGAAEAERRARATAILGKEYGEAFVAPHGAERELHFFVSRGTKPDQLAPVGVPLSSIQAFELGTAEEWFMDLAQAEQRRMGSAPNSWVIVAPTLGHGVVPVAESGGAKAGIAALHGLLTREFVMASAEMQERWKAKLEEMQGRR